MHTHTHHGARQVPAHCRVIKLGRSAGLRCAAASRLGPPCGANDRQAWQAAAGRRLSNIWLANGFSHRCFRGWGPTSVFIPRGIHCSRPFTQEVHKQEALLARSYRTSFGRFPADTIASKNTNVHAHPVSRAGWICLRVQSGTVDRAACVTIRHR